MNNILITSAGKRVSLVKAFKKELIKYFPTAKVFVVDSDIEHSAAAQVADNAFKIVKINDFNYIDSLLEICIKNKVTVIIPTLDTGLRVLSKNIDKFSQHGINIVISDSNIITHCNSKKSSKRFFEKFNINSPKLYSKDNYKLPLFIKPNTGSSSQDNFIIKKEASLSKSHFTNKELLFFEYIDRSQYDEFTCDLYYDKSSVLKCVIPRRRIQVRAGEVMKARTERNELVGFFKTKLLNFKGVRGCINIQCFLNKTSRDIIVIEMNPRFGGGYPLSYLAGGNYPKWIIQEYLLNEQIPYFDDWEDQLLMLRYDDEILVHGNNRK
jgi:carbamoyl-phosphate synthase large subunit